MTRSAAPPGGEDSMPSPGDRHADWLRRAGEQPWRHELFALLRRLAAAAPDAPGPGHARWPREESVRLGQAPSLAFAPREIAGIQLTPSGCRVDLFGLGMLGPNGALPLHYTELARERLQTTRDAALVDFLDLFHHRAITLLYRAWAQAQAAAGLDRREQEVFTRYVSSLAGDRLPAPAAPWPAHARWASAAQRLRRSPAPQGLCAALRDYLRLPVRLREFTLRWLAIDPAERSRLGAPDRGARLGDAAVLGDRVPDRQGCFTLSLGPLTLAQYLDVLPQRGRGACFEAVHACVRGFVGMEQAWELELVLPASQTRPAALGAPDALARNAWLGDARAAADAQGWLRVVFDAEGMFEAAGRRTPRPSDPRQGASRQDTLPKEGFS